MTDLDPLVTRLQAHLAQLGDGHDARSDNERATYWENYNATQRLITKLRNDPADLAREELALAVAVATRETVIAKETELGEQIASAADPSSIADARERDREYARQESLHTQLRLLRLGSLHSGPGVLFPRVEDVDQHIATLTAKVTTLRGNLATYVAEGEALLAVPVTAG